MENLVPVDHKIEPVIEKPAIQHIPVVEEKVKTVQPKTEPIIENIIASEPIVEKVTIPKPVSSNQQFMQSVPIPTQTNNNIRKDNEYIQNKNTKVNYISDDQFFDDFFNEDD